MNIKRLAAATIAAASLLSACGGGSSTPDSEDTFGVVNGSDVAGEVPTGAGVRPGPTVEAPEGAGVRTASTPAHLLDPIGVDNTTGAAPAPEPDPATYEALETSTVTVVDGVVFESDVPAPDPAPDPTRVGEWSMNSASGRWVHDSGTLAFEPSGASGVLYDLVYGYAVDYNTGLVYDPNTGQWVDLYAQGGGGGDWSSDGAGWSYGTSGGYFGYGASDGTTTGFSFSNGCTVLDGSVSC